MRFVYKDIHFGAIATFYIIALLVRLITILVFNKFLSIETNYALQVSASLATGLGPAIGALVAMLIFKRRTEYTLIGIWFVGRIWLARLFAIRTQGITCVAICTYYHNDVASVAFRFILSKYFVILPTSAFRFMGNRKGGD